MSAPFNALAEFNEYADALRARLGRERRAGDEGELRELWRRWEAAQQLHEAWCRGELEEPGPGHLRVISPPPPRDLVAAEFGEVEAPEPTPPKKKAGKSYDSELATEVIRRVLAAPRPTRGLRDQLHDEQPKITTTLVAHVLDQTRDRRLKGAPYKRLSPSRRKRWERAVDRIAENGTTTWDELTRLLK